MQESLAAEWGWFKRAVRSVRRVAKKAVRRVATTARRVGGRIVHIATSTFNWAKNKARSLVNQFKAYAKKVNLMKKLKYGVDKFFQVTESRPFKIFFMRVVGKIMRAYGFSSANVKAAYKLLTRRFWNTQFWFWKWIVTGGFIKSAKSSSGSRDFSRAVGACKDFVGTVDLGASVMMKMRTFPQVVAAGGTIKVAAKVSKPICRVFGYIAKWHKAYMKVKSLLAKCGINLPL